jgi:hypothetical protein
MGITNRGQYGLIFHVVFLNSDLATTPIRLDGVP